MEKEGQINILKRNVNELANACCNNHIKRLTVRIVRLKSYKEMLVEVVVEKS